MVNRPSNLFHRADPRTFIRDLPGVGSRLLPRIIEDLGEGDPEVALLEIERNAYSLTSVDGIGFKKADKIAQDVFDIEQDDPRRHEAGNRFILEQKGVLTQREFIAERLKLELRDPTHIQSGIELENDLYWLPEELDAEKGLEGWLRGLPTPGEACQLAELTPAQQAVCERLTLDEQQTRAVQAILANPVTTLTGGAGCGKTHIVAAAAQCLAVEGKSVRGMAFAGKAADRMREAFDRYGILADASTIHKALGFQKKAFTVEWLSEDLIVIDESSMLPNWLAWAVIKRLAPSTRIVLVGDPNQLPPIGYGTPFVDIIKHGVARVHLLKNYRQQDQQGILHVAEGILHRKRPQPAECVEFHLGVAEANLVPLFRSLVEKHGGQEFDAWQCITYQNENAERYNLAAQDVINPHGAPLFEYPLWRLGTEPGSKRPKYRAEVREGDKIIVVKNSTLLGIFNGQTGRVLGQVYKAKEVQRRDPVNGGWEVARGEHMMHLRVKIGNQAEPVEIPGDELEKYIQLGYVITVHKAQGSDWDRVIVMQPGPVRNDTARRFFYTATTRSKNHLVIVSMATVVAWWTNAAADAPEVDSSLTVRLSRPAPEPVGVGFCEFDALATDDDYEAEPGPEYDAAIEAVGAARPLLYSEWQDVKAAHARSPIVTADDPRPAAWRGLRQHPQQPESVATAVALDVGLDVAELERIQALWDDMEVA